MSKILKLIMCFGIILSIGLVQQIQISGMEQKYTNQETRTQEEQMGQVISVLENQETIEVAQLYLEGQVLSGDDHGNSFETATQVQVGIENPGSIEVAGDEDYFKFIPNVSGVYTVESTGSLNYPLGWIYDKEEKQLYYSSYNRYGEGNNFYTVIELTQNQEYYIKVRHGSASQIGEYGLKISKPADDYGNSFTTALPINFNTDIQSEINYECDIDMFSITPVVSQTYTIRTYGDMDTYGIVYNSSGSYIKSNNDISSEDKNFSISVSLLANEIYYVRVTNYKCSDKDTANMGNYTLYTAISEDDHGNSFETSTLVQVGTETSSVLEVAGDKDYYKFMPEVNGVYGLESSGELSDLYVGLFDEDEKAIPYSYYKAHGGIGANFYTTQELLGGKSYYVRVASRSSSETGHYGLKISKLNDDYGNSFETAYSIDLGTSVEGEIQYACDKDIFKFIPELSESYIIETEGETDTYGILYNSSNKYLTQGNDISTTDKNFKFAYTLGHVFKVLLSI